MLPAFWRHETPINHIDNLQKKKRKNRKYIWRLYNVHIYIIYMRVCIAHNEWKWIPPQSVVNAREEYRTLEPINTFIRICNAYTNSQVHIIVDTHKYGYYMYIVCELYWMRNWSTQFGTNTTHHIQYNFPQQYAYILMVM